MDENITRILKEATEEIKKAKKGLTQADREQFKKAIIEDVTKSVLKAIEPLFKDSREVVELMAEIAKSPEIRKQEMLEAIKSWKLEPKIIIPEIKLPDIPTPNIEVHPAEVRFPPIPTPQVTVNPPDINIPEIKMPKEIKVKGFGDFLRAMTAIFKGRLDVMLGNVDKNNPLPVILTDEDGVFYRAVLHAVSGGGGGIARIVEVRKGASPQIFAVTITSADTSYSLELPANTTMIDIKLRGQGAQLKYSWSDWGGYMTIPAGGSRHIDNILLDKAKTIYFQSPTATQTVEVEVFTQ